MQCHELRAVLVGPMTTPYCQRCAERRVWNFTTMLCALCDPSTLARKRKGKTGSDRRAVRMAERVGNLARAVGR